MTQYDEKEGLSNGNSIRLFGAIIFLSITSSYFFLSSIPHGWNNLKAA